MSGRSAPHGRGPRDRWLERRLERYAREELDPDHAALAAGRERLLERFAATREGAGAEPHATTMAAGRGEAAPASSRLARIRRALAGRGMVPVPLRIAGATASIVLLLVAAGAGAAAASAPGGPLYDARVGLEALTLPASGSPAWLDAEVRRLDERIGEATAAAGRGNVGALDAAVAAYTRILRDVAASTGTGTRIPGTLAAALDRHERELEQLAARERPPAAAALDELLRDVEAVHGDAAPPADGASGSRPEETPHPGRAASPGGASSGAPGKAGTAPGNAGGAHGNEGTAPGNAGSAPGHQPAATHPATQHRSPPPTPSQAAFTSAGSVLALEAGGTPDAVRAQEAPGSHPRLRVHPDGRAKARHRAAHGFAAR